MNKVVSSQFMVENGQDMLALMPKVPFATREGSGFGVEVLALEELRLRELDHSIFMAHRTEFHLLVAVSGGQGWHMVDFIQYPIERGTLIHIAPGQVLRYDSENDVTGFVVLFKPEVSRAKVPHSRWPPSFKPSTGDFDLLESLVQIMFDLNTFELSTASDRIAWRMLPALLEICDGAVAQYFVREGAPSEEFEAFDALLNENFTQCRKLTWYARKLGYSQKTLSRWCRRAVGTNAKAHIDHRVALEAKRLLVHTDHSVELIAVRLGFSESTNFVKFFKRIVGATPSAFQHSYS